MLYLVGFCLPVAVVVGVLAGGRIDRLAGLRVAWWWWMVPTAFAAQLLAILGPDELRGPLGVPLILGSHAALVALALRNLRIPGLPLAALGLAMNLAVMAANGGLMPVAPETLAAAGRTEAWKIGDGSPGTRVARSKDVILRREDTVLEPLADRYIAALPVMPTTVIFSLGDVVLLGGLSWLVVRTMTRRDSHDEREDEQNPARTPGAPVTAGLDGRG